MAKSFVKAIELFAYDTTNLSGNYDSINPDGTENPCFLIRIINNSNADIIISYDGVTDHDFLPPNDTLQLPFQSNSSPNNFQALLKKGTVVWVKSPGGGAGTGDVYLAGYYQEV